MFGEILSWLRGEDDANETKHIPRKKSKQPLVFRSVKQGHRPVNYYNGNLKFGKKSSKSYPKLLNYIQDNNKYAILMGGDPENNLRGSCNNDLRKLVALCHNKYHIPYDNIYVLTQEEENMGPLTFCRLYLMDQENLQNIVDLFISKLANIDRKFFLFVAYSGHGHVVERTDVNIREYDTALQIEEENVLNSIVFREAFFDKLRSNVTIFCLWDACHSGKMLNLPYEYDQDEHHWIDHPYTFVNKSSAKIMSIGACEPNQFDVQVNSEGYEGGALTSVFISSEKFYYGLDNPDHIITKMSTYLLNFGQKPVLSSTHYKKKVIQRK